MVVQDDPPSLDQVVDILDHPSSHLYMPAHDLPLLLGQFPRFVEDGVGNADLADVMEQGAVTEELQLLSNNTELYSH